ncbi:MAG: DEAD/DEAH box helicase family protein [Lachnospiraceae bacterium]|nr:DEAD/DEAH box helicase family protein [Lachnospiraceae bacterium]
MNTDMGLPEFQAKTVDKVVQMFERNRRVLVADEVGLGKTYIAKGVIQEMALKKRKVPFRVLYMAPNAMILEENVKKLLPKSGERLLKAAYIPGSRLNEMYLKETGSGNYKDIELYSMSPGIVFQTHSKRGTAEERRTMLGVVNSVFTDEPMLKEYFKKLIELAEGGAKVNAAQFSVPQEIKDYILNDPYIEELGSILHILREICKAEPRKDWWDCFNADDDNLENLVRRSISEEKPIEEKDLKDLYRRIDIILSIKKNLPLNLPEDLMSPDGMSFNERLYRDFSRYIFKVRKYKGQYVSQKDQPDDSFSKIRDIISMAMYSYLGIDLIIADEFHRYFGKQEIESIEKMLEGNDTKLLLLSATPYRMNEIKMAKDKKAYIESYRMEDLEVELSERRGSRITKEPFSSLGDVLYYLKEGEKYEQKPGGKQKNDPDNIKDVYDKKMDSVRESIKKLAMHAEKKNEEEFSGKWEELCTAIKELEEMIAPYIVRTERIRALNKETDKPVENITRFLLSEEKPSNLKGVYQMFQGQKPLSIKKEDISNDRYLKKEAEAIRASINVTGNIGCCKSTPYPASFSRGYRHWGWKDETTIPKSIPSSEEAAEYLYWDGKPYRYGEHRKMDMLLDNLSGEKTFDSEEVMSDISEPEKTFNTEVKKEAGNPCRKVSEQLSGKLLWMPPLLRKNGEPGGCFKEFEENTEGQYTKTLVFSKYHMSAAAVSILLSSYEPFHNVIHDERSMEGLPGSVKQQTDCLKQQIERFDISDFYDKAVKDLKGDIPQNNGPDDLCQAFKVYFTNHMDVLVRAGVGDAYPLEQYCKDGCLADVLSEWMFVNNILSKEDLLGKANGEANSSRSGLQVLCGILRHIPPAVKVLLKDNDGKIMQELTGVRCSFAELYTEDREDSGSYDPEYAGEIQQAFNSPFFPFVLSVTDAAQEGIDLHNYCHQIMHWDFSIDPVAFEQKGGRINRRLGHLIRKRMAEDVKKGRYPLSGGNWWSLLEEIKKECPEQYKRNKGLFPEWYYFSGESRFNLRRIMTGFPLNSKDKIIYEYLVFQLGFYRIAVGLDVEMESVDCIMEYIKDKDKNIEEIMLNLSPAFSG